MIGYIGDPPSGDARRVTLFRYSGKVRFDAKIEDQ
jgi:hypothetical protein